MMNVILLALVALVFAVPCLAEEPASYPGYELVWRDEFERDGQPNPDNWVYEEGFVRNNELQWYTPENAKCEDGLLVIEARRVSRPNPNYEPGSDNWRRNRETIDYTSSCLLTRGEHAWLYGRFEVRAKVPIEAGMWPAIWLLGTGEAGNGGWPRCGEVDVMEYYRGKVYANACWAGERGRSEWDGESLPIEEVTDLSPQAWAAKFHVWRMDWDEQQIKLYLDDRLMNTIDLSQTVNATDDGLNPFHHPHYILLNLAIGSNGGDPGGTDFPRQYLVDYVRVYQQTSAD